VFPEVVKENDIQITNENISGLSQLCVEFGFRSLSLKLSAFRDSPRVEIWLTQGFEAEFADQAQTLSFRICDF
jgi:hypothetical protein